LPRWSLVIMQPRRFSSTGCNSSNNRSASPARRGFAIERDRRDQAVSRALRKSGAWPLGNERRKHRPPCFESRPDRTCGAAIMPSENRHVQRARQFGRDNLLHRNRSCYLRAPGTHRNDLRLHFTYRATPVPHLVTVGNQDLFAPCCRYSPDPRSLAALYI
jgi:hypothetical protein